MNTEIILNFLRNEKPDFQKCVQFDAPEKCIASIKLSALVGQLSAKTQVFKISGLPGFWLSFNGELHFESFFTEELEVMTLTYESYNKLEEYYRKNNA